MLTFWKNPDIAFVHTQLFQLSPDAGRSNKMVHLDWLEYSSNLKGGIIDVLLEIQKRSLFCIPEIDFKEISSQLYYRETVAYNMTREISRCETQQLLEMVRAMYVDDIKCIKQWFITITLIDISTPSTPPPPPTLCLVPSRPGYNDSWMSSNSSNFFFCALALSRLLSLLNVDQLFENPLLFFGRVHVISCALPYWKANLVVIMVESVVLFFF